MFVFGLYSWIGSLVFFPLLLYIRFIIFSFLAVLFDLSQGGHTISSPILYTVVCLKHTGNGVLRYGGYRWLNTLHSDS